MVTIKTGCKSVILALAMVSSGFSGAVSLPNSNQMAIVATLVVIGLKVHLDTHPSCDDYKVEDWYEDAKSFLKSYDLWNAESRKMVMHLAYKWIRGSKLKFKDRMVRVRNEDGSVQT